MWKVIKTKIKCKICGDILTPKNNTEWVECSCGAVQVVGHGTFKAIRGKQENYEDLSSADFENIPPHKGW